MALDGPGETQKELMELKKSREAADKIVNRATEKDLSSVTASLKAQDERDKIDKKIEDLSEKFNKLLLEELKKNTTAVIKEGVFSKNHDERVVAFTAILHKVEDLVKSNPKVEINLTKIEKDIQRGLFGKELTNFTKGIELGSSSLGKGNNLSRYGTLKQKFDPPSLKDSTLTPRKPGKY